MDWTAFATILNDEELGRAHAAFWDEVQSRMKLKAPSMPAPLVNECTDNRFNNIKRYRERLGCSLMLAKMVIDLYSKD